MKKWLIKLLGGFTDANDFVQHLKNIDELPERNRILSEATKELFNTISSDDIFHQEGLSHFFQGKQLIAEQVIALKNEAQFFKKTKCFQVLDYKVKYICNKKLHEAGTIADLIAAKSVLYTWDIIKDAMNKELK